MNQAKIEQIANELADLFASGNLTFEAFKLLYLEADKAGEPDLEFFCPYARHASWMDWIRDYHRSGPSAKVA